MDGPPAPAAAGEDDEGTYVVNSILNHQVSADGARYFYILWSDGTATWEPEENVLSAELIVEYFQQVQQRQRQPQPQSNGSGGAVNDAAVAVGVPSTGGPSLGGSGGEAPSDRAERVTPVKRPAAPADAPGADDAKRPRLCPLGDGGAAGEADAAEAWDGGAAPPTADASPAASPLIATATPSPAREASPILAPTVITVAPPPSPSPSPSPPPAAEPAGRASKPPKAPRARKVGKAKAAGRAAESLADFVQAEVLDTLLPKANSKDTTAAQVKLSSLTMEDPFGVVDLYPGRAALPPKPAANTRWQLCAECFYYGQVILCDTCTCVYHLGCHVPPLAAAPPSDVRAAPDGVAGPRRDRLNHACMHAVLVSVPAAQVPWSCSACTTRETACAVCLGPCSEGAREAPTFVCQYCRCRIHPSCLPAAEAGLGYAVWKCPWCLRYPQPVGRILGHRAATEVLGKPCKVGRLAGHAYWWGPSGACTLTSLLRAPLVAHTDPDARIPGEFQKLVVVPHGVGASLVAVLHGPDQASGLRPQARYGRRPTRRRREGRQAAHFLRGAAVGRRVRRRRQMFRWMPWKMCPKSTTRWTACSAKPPYASARAQTLVAALPSDAAGAAVRCLAALA